MMVLLYRNNLLPPVAIPVIGDKAPRVELVAGMTVNQASLLAIFNRAAEEGRRCPTNSEIRDYFNFSDNSGAGRLTDALVQTGVITIERFSQSRVVTITASGKRTATPKSTAPHWRNRKEKP